MTSSPTELPPRPRPSESAGRRPTDPPSTPTAVGARTQVASAEPLGVLPGGQQPAAFEVYVPPVRPEPKRFQPDGADLVLAICVGVLGFLCWEWHVPLAALGASVFYLACIVVVLAYFAHRGVTQNARSGVLLAVAVAGALRFAFFAPRDIDLVFHAAQVSICLLWVAYSCRTAGTRRWDGYVAVDWLNQVFVVPLGNFGRWFQSVGWALRSRNRLRSVFLVGAGVVVCVPVFAVVLLLLANSDDSFTGFLDWFAGLFVFDSVGRYFWELVFALPVAAYIVGSVVGNQRRLRVDRLTDERAESAMRRARGLNRASLYGPLAVLVAIYAVYFWAMGSYLFSAWTGALPGGFSYAQYARQGFFELCGVATINLCALAAAYLFAKRGAGEHPRPLRVLGGAIAVFTCLLIATAMSKLVLYVGTYGLSQLRLYALWFLVVLFGVFVTLVVWHLRPFDASRPIVWTLTALVALLCFANTDGIIAGFNVQQYLDRPSQAQIDVDTIARLSDAAVPALSELAASAPDPQVRAHAQRVVDRRHELAASTGFADWNLQTWLVLTQK